MLDERHLPDADCWRCGHVGLILDTTTSRKRCPACGRVILPHPNRVNYDGARHAFNEDRHRRA